MRKIQCANVTTSITFFFFFLNKPQEPSVLVLPELQLQCTQLGGRIERSLGGCENGRNLVARRTQSINQSAETAGRSRAALTAGASRRHRPPATEPGADNRYELPSGVTNDNRRSSFREKSVERGKKKRLPQERTEQARKRSFRRLLRRMSEPAHNDLSPWASDQRQFLALV